MKDTTDSDLKGTGDAVLRLYVGSNQHKAIGEIQGTWRAANQPLWLGNLGGEFKLNGALWITATLGYEANGRLGDGRLVSNWKLKFTPSGG